MDTVFNAQPQPHEEAISLIKGRKPVAARVFYGLLPELRSRAFTVSGVEGASVLQRIRDSIAGLPAGQTWDDVKGSLVDDLSPFLGEGAERRAEMLLRTSGFQAFTSATYRTAQEDDDTTHLQYIHGDQAEVPTPSHEALDGIVLPKDDAFWENHTGPWGHIGCVCYVRPMNPDLVDVERARDEGKDAPEDRNVVEGGVAEALRNGTLMRGGRRFDVSAPEGQVAFQWHPDDLRLPVGDVLQRYDDETQADFTAWARNTFVGPDTTAWNWLNSAPAAKRSAAEIRRQDRRTIRLVDERKNANATKPPPPQPPPQPPRPPSSPAPIRPTPAATASATPAAPVPAPAPAPVPPKPRVRRPKPAAPAPAPAAAPDPGIPDRLPRDYATVERGLSVLTKERSYGWDAQGAPIPALDKQGTKNTVTFTAHELSLMKDATLVHNHPSGCSFSWADINVLIQMGLREIIAVGVKSPFTYHMRLRSPIGHVDRHLLKAEYEMRHAHFVAKTRAKVDSGELDALLAWQEAGHEAWSHCATKFPLIYERRPRA